MKISPDVVKDLISAMRRLVEAETIDTGSQLLTLYRLDDVIASFTQADPAQFYGITFEALGQDFSIIHGLEVLVMGENDEGDDEPVLVNDETLMALLEEFLIWRTRVIDKFGA